MSNEYRSWGNFPPSSQRGMRLPSCPKSPLQEYDDKILPFGNGRSYGDVCLNPDGVVVDTRNHDHFIQFCPDSGRISCQAGVQLAQILDLVIPHGWFLPVTPGTKFVTVGGAIANDVHGKNHHVAGSFGNHVLALSLLGSDGNVRQCSEGENSALFHASIGGLGLTGLIMSAEIQLKPIGNAALETESIKYGNVAEFFQLSRQSEQDYEYTVAWVDCLATGKQLGRGLFIRGNHASSLRPGKISKANPLLQVPFTPPISLINKWSLKCFNQAYYHKQFKKRLRSLVAYNPFFYPLDGVKNWNRIYGRQGFLQHQCVVPMPQAEDVIAELIAFISSKKVGSFLVVLKMLGDVQSKGLLSFCRPGATLALDFPYTGPETLALFRQLNEIVSQGGGAIYPAKDATMSEQQFKKAYPRWQEFEKFIDPQFNSQFWDRVMGRRQHGHSENQNQCRGIQLKA